MMLAIGLGTRIRIRRPEVEIKLAGERSEARRGGRVVLETLDVDRGISGAAVELPGPGLGLCRVFHDARAALHCRSAGVLSDHPDPRPWSAHRRPHRVPGDPRCPENSGQSQIINVQFRRLFDVRRLLQCLLDLLAYGRGTVAAEGLIDGGRLERPFRHGAHAHGMQRRGAHFLRGARTDIDEMILGAIQR